MPAGILPLIWSLLINFLGPYAIYSLTEPYFAPGSTMPLLLSALVPAAELAFVFKHRRMVDVIAIISLVQLAAGISITLLAHSASAAITGHALMPVALGLAFGISILVGQPLVQPLARQTMAGNDPEKQARFDQISRLEGARRVFVRLTWVWAVTLCVNSAILLTAAHTLPARDYVLVSPIITYGILGLLIWGAIRYGRQAVSKTVGAATLKGPASEPHR
jgi:uncharacterized membrane protein